MWAVWVLRMSPTWSWSCELRNGEEVQCRLLAKIVASQHKLFCVHFWPPSLGLFTHHCSWVSYGAYQYLFWWISLCILDRAMITSWFSTLTYNKAHCQRMLEKMPNSNASFIRNRRRMIKVERKYSSICHTQCFDFENKAYIVEMYCVYSTLLCFYAIVGKCFGPLQAAHCYIVNVWCDVLLNCNKGRRQASSQLGSKMRPSTRLLGHYLRCWSECNASHEEFNCCIWL